MKGKVGLVIGLAAGYVLGSRAGRERYEQIKEQAVKAWHTDPVQKQVDKAKAFGTSAAKVVPGVLWDGAKRVTTAAGGSGSVSEKAQRAAAAAKSAARDVADAVEDSLEEAEEAATDSASGDTKTSSDTKTGQKKADETKSATSAGS
ncbi:hypothetical protein [Microbacterium lushaniae]|uniref:Protoporphyrinogen oxidase n=1 Tax=Microbacterium lushaniae TaxID=2614639 RepID=A0A5J6L7N8_9MICO|nr:hypothetical protein [Microbacterium lushaniae]QEW04468.1 hypothetical protein F6J85_16195 [Microbacterium lushaniae]